MSFSDLYVTRRTRKNHPLLAMEKLIDWVALERAIHSHYAPVSDAAGLPAYAGEHARNRPYVNRVGL
ncbi:MAG: hypothetical protein ORN21_05060 [Methylophilaceae bacterium]|nr:hypothetical protein [Methylophilaceae bacterium]